MYYAENGKAINIISKDELQEEEAINLPNDVGYGYSNSTLNPKYTFDTFVVGISNYISSISEEKEYPAVM